MYPGKYAVCEEQNGRFNCQSFLLCGANFLFSLLLSDLNLVKGKRWSVSCDFCKRLWISRDHDG